MTSAPRRLRGPIAVIVFVAVSAAAVTGAWMALGQRPQPTDIIDLSAIDSDYAVIVRDVRGDDGRSFLSLFERVRGEIWGALIPRYPALRGERTGLVTTTGVVTVRTVPGGVPEMIAFAAAHGRKLGRTALTSDDGGATDSTLPHVGSVFGNGESYEFVAEAGGAAVVALNVERGVRRWRRTLGTAAVGPVWLRERHLLAYQRPARSQAQTQSAQLAKSSDPNEPQPALAGTLQILERTTGRMHTVLGAQSPGMPLAPWPCVSDDRVYGLDRETLRAIWLDDMREQTSQLPGVAQLAGGCGQYRDREVLLAVADNGNGVVVAIDRQTLQPAWQLDLGAPVAARAQQLQRNPDALPPAGRLGRFVPLLVGPAKAKAMVMVDVDSGRVAWRSAAPTSALADARIMSIAMPDETRRYYLWVPENETLAVFSGDTGALEAAMSLPGHAAVWPKHFADGRVWIHGAQHWAVLDGGSLAPVAPAVGPDVVEVRDSLARLTGAPLVP